MVHEHTNRPGACGYYPFWFWNGELTEEEIRWQVAEMAAKGILGFYIHPRQGLRQPYLSEAFFRMVRTAVEVAETHGLIVNLYDEYPYPSGVAGGEVVLGHPEYCATRLVQQAFDTLGEPLRRALPRGEVLCCMAYPLVAGEVDWSRGVDLRTAIGVVLAEDSYNEMGLTRYNRKRYFASLPTPTLEIRTLDGPHRVFVSVQAAVDRFKYWGEYVDVLNPEAIRRFIALTHERYRKELEDRFGTTIQAIFVDETSPGWSARIPEAFRAAYGYDLLPLLPALQDETHPRHLQVIGDLAQLTYQLFCESFEEPVAHWCRAHGLRYAGEKPTRRLAQLAYMDIPGGDPGHTKAGATLDLLRPHLRQNARATASAAYFYGKEGALCECFHSLGWSGTLQDAKVISEGLLLMGTRYLVPHGFFYTTHSLAKHDAPPTFFFQMPYWSLYGALSERVARIGVEFEGTHISANLLLVDPNPGLPTRQHLHDYERLLQLLMEEHLDVLIVDTDILESGRLEGGKVRIRNVSAAAVVLPPMRVVEPPLAGWLDRFAADGGTVLRLPAGYERETYRRMLAECVRPSLQIDARQGDASRLYVVRRTEGSRDLWFLLNTGSERLQVVLDAGVPLREIPLDEGMPPALVQTGSTYGRHVAPFESLLIEAGSAEQGTEALPLVAITVPREARITPLSANLLRMGEWEMTLLSAEGQALQTATVSAIPLPNQLAQGGFRFAPTVETFFGAAPELRLPEMQVSYRFTFENYYGGPITLVMEPGSIVGEWEIRVNEGAPIREADLGEVADHVRGSLGADVTPHVVQGRNDLTVSLVTDRVDGGLLNPLYLAGEFGVRLDPLRLVPLEIDGTYEDWEGNGLPYYAGTVEYDSMVDVSDVPTAPRVLLEIEHGLPFQDACEVSVNDSPWLAMPWSPYRAVLDGRHLRAGANQLRIRVYTTLIRSFEGHWWDIEGHVYREVGTGREVVDIDRRPPPVV